VGEPVGVAAIRAAHQQNFQLRFSTNRRAMRRAICTTPRRAIQPNRTDFDPHFARRKVASVITRLAVIARQAKPSRYLAQVCSAAAQLCDSKDNFIHKSAPPDAVALNFSLTNQRADSLSASGVNWRLRYERHSFRFA
jgi:hypothetical protein